MKTALLSAFRKEGLPDFARRLVARGWNLLASGGTAKCLAEARIPVTDVATIVGPPILGHRVVTLSREIHAALLAKDTPEDAAELTRIGVPRIDLVYVDLYPLERETLREGSTLDSVLEQEDIGGPTMLSSAAKGKRIVISDPADCGPVLQMLESDLPFDTEYREHLAAKADFIVSRYRMLTARFRGNGAFEAIHGILHLPVAYGENPWLASLGLFSTQTDYPLALDKYVLMNGEDILPSYNTWGDLDRAQLTLLHIMAGLERNGLLQSNNFCTVGVKHGNACSVGIGNDSGTSLKRAMEGDITSIFGGLVIHNGGITAQGAEILLHHVEPSGKRVLDAVASTVFSSDAIDLLRRKTGKCRILRNPALSAASLRTLVPSLTSKRIKSVAGGFLPQADRNFVPCFGDGGGIAIHGSVRPLLHASTRIADLVLAWAIGSTSTSNTITLVKDGQLIANMVGQQSRVRAAKFAVLLAGENGHSTHGAVAYSDSFFPFPDGPKVLIDAGVKAIFTSSGSIRDQETIDLCLENNVALFMVPDKVGRGFYH
ncbi:MAG: hypothetical protein A2664_02390 [Candidatus Taylorbacteria bacterium RIFCSPHIGHO2_01_FULL_46_22b]|uniref:MGS-like domain-containing protein n=1 Tax=Candidatus Taylorbacteria bacterium RIFCSPHIGHO2_01_FULL_46_22b TaxID=1802301 RepID=A0A1G2M332_9BACT|nr:MAG: hypothetical protein A2664_02390 [Candidatus Taylorbacteria bacterium RIFCSPHIGHO2_01_FULL_46_22b]